MWWRPRLFQPKAGCAPSRRETVTLHRGRRPPHARRASMGTQETRPGPSGWSPTGVRHEGRPECPIEPRSGVGPAHSTDDAAEGNEVGRGKGPARRELAPGGQGPDAGPGHRASKPEASERGSQEGQEGPIHGAVASCRRGGAGARLSAGEAEGGSRGGWRDGRELRGESRGAAEGLVRSGTPRTLPAAAGPTRVHPESRWRAAADWSAGARGQGGPRGGGRSAERHLRGRLSGVFLRVPTGSQSSRGASVAAHGVDDAVRELGARRGHPQLLRLGGPRVDAANGRASGGRPSHVAADRAMAASRRDGRPGVAGDVRGDATRGGDQSAPGEHLSALRARPVGPAMEEEAGARASQSRALCGRLRDGLSERDGRTGDAGGPQGAAGEVQAGTPRGTRRASSSSGNSWPSTDERATHGDRGRFRFSDSPTTADGAETGALWSSGGPKAGESVGSCRRCRRS